jgi:hypothetical protein
VGGAEDADFAQSLELEFVFWGNLFPQR